MDERTAMMMAVVVVVVAAAAGGGCTRGERATARARERETHIRSKWRRRQFTVRLTGRHFKLRQRAVVAASVSVGVAIDSVATFTATHTHTRAHGVKRKICVHV